MVMSVGRLVAYLEGNTAQFDQAMERSGARLQRFSDRAVAGEGSTRRLERALISSSTHFAEINPQLERAGDALLNFYGWSAKAVLGVSALTIWTQVAIETYKVFNIEGAQAKERLKDLTEAASKAGGSPLRTLTNQINNARQELEKLNKEADRAKRLTDLFPNSSGIAAASAKAQAKSAALENVLRILTEQQAQLIASQGMGILGGMGSNQRFGPQFTALTEMVAGAIRRLLASPETTDLERQQLLNQAAGLPNGLTAGLLTGFARQPFGVSAGRFFDLTGLMPFSPFRAPAVSGLGAEFYPDLPLLGRRIAFNAPRFGGRAAGQIFGKLQADPQITADAVTRAVQRTVTQLGLVASSLDLLATTAGGTQTRIGGFAVGVSGLLSQGAGLVRNPQSALFKGLSKAAGFASIAGAAIDLGSSLFSGLFHHGPDPALVELQRQTAILKRQLEIQETQYKASAVIFEDERTGRDPRRADLVAQTIADLAGRNVEVHVR